jgi:hypothetical protein
MKKKWTLVLDGEKLPYRHFSEKIEQARFLSTPKGGETGNVIIGFTSEKLYKKWAKKQGLLKNYEDSKKALARIKRKRLTPTQKKEIRYLQANKVMADSRRISKELKVRGIDFRKLKKNDIKKLDKMSRGYEDFGGPFLHRGWIWNYRGWSGGWRYLASGTFYPDFDWFNFYNKAESGYVLWPGVCVLYDGPWWGGASFTFHGALSTFANFRNRASSGYVWP